MIVYLLQHTRDLDEDTSENKVIGVYSSETQAERAIERLRVQPGFCDFPGDFNIGEYVIDRDSWSEGFTMA